jgi:hypothetical protein
VITLIMLSVTLVMALAFLALARRERGSVTTTTDSTTARLAADTALACAQAQLAANILSGFTGLGSSNAYNLHLFVSTNYINPYGFTPNNGNPTNVNYYYAANSVANWNQNIANLWFLPRVPVFVYTNTASPSPPAGTSVYDFRYYLDLNENGAFEPNGWQPVVSDNPNYPYYDTNKQPLAATDVKPPNILSNFFVGDPEWVGVLEHPDAPHGPNNHFISRYAFIAVPAGNALDVNSIHNQVHDTLPLFQGGAGDGFLRNQGVGSWELNLAAFLADLNTNVWSPLQQPGQQPGNLYYNYNRPYGQANQGRAFADADSLLLYRYQSNQPPSATYFFPNANRQLLQSGIDAYSVGPVQTNLDYNRYVMQPIVSTLLPWAGANSTNHYFTLGDFLDGSKLSIGVNNFTNRLRYGGTTNIGSDPLGVVLQPSYDRYTFYRMLDELGSDSTPDDGKLNLNYSNAVVTYANINGVNVPTSVGVVTGAETNLVRWRPQDFFNAAADQMLRLYSTYWFQSNPTNYLATYYGYFPTNYVDATGVGVVNIPYYGVTNQIPSFGITNIPVLMNSNFVYTAAVNRLLQLAANIYDATTNNNSSSINFNLPHVFRPIFEHDIYGNVLIVGYTTLSSVNGPNTVSSANDSQFVTPRPISDLPLYSQANTPIFDIKGPLVNVYGVPWVIGAKKGLPNFEQFSYIHSAQVTRKLEFTRSSIDVTKSTTFTTNQAIIVGPITNGLGISFWNPYNTTYPRPLRVVVSDYLNIVMTNAYNVNGSTVWPLHTDFSPTNLFTNVVVNFWPGSQWYGTAPNWLPVTQSFLNFTWGVIFQSPFVYNFASHDFIGGTFQPGVPNLDQFSFAITNQLQAYILDGNNVIDYVQLTAPISVGGLNQALADPPYAGSVRFQWSTNNTSGGVPYGVDNQVYISAHGPLPVAQMPPGGQWNSVATAAGATGQAVSPAGEAAFFTGFFNPTYQFDGKTYQNREHIIQAPYTPSRTVYTSYLLQANDPLVHYLGSDMNGQTGARAIWAALQTATNGAWTHSDDPGGAQPLPSPPVTPIKGRFQPWGQIGQMLVMGGTVDQNVYNLAYKDPLIWGPDDWDFPTNLYPTVGWLGRVHRGTPWQTVYLKSTNILSWPQLGSSYGVSTWTTWTGDALVSPGGYYDAVNCAPLQDYLLFDVFTTRFNDNAVRGTLPVNVGMGRGDGGLAAWSALFSGMAVLTNNVGFPRGPITVQYTNQIISPAGAETVGSPLWAIVNGTNGINATRANTNLFPYHAFTRMGNILATPALSVKSPFLATNSTLPNGTVVPSASANQLDYGINDEMYEWLPQQMMGLVRATEPRYVLYCYGQSLRPAPNGTVLGGQYSQLVTNYQVVAETAVRAVIRVDGANTAQPHVVVESYNVLPPN